MSAKLLDGRPLAEKLKARIAADISDLRSRGRPVSLVAVQVGEKAESLMYVESQRRLCEGVGIDFRLEQLPDSIAQTDLLQTIDRLNRDAGVQGIILQLPLPARLDAKLCQRAIDPKKDAEGVHPANLGLLVYGVTRCAPCTAIAAYHIIKSLHKEVDLYGKEAVVVGHSQIVGMPIGLLLLHDFCTTTTCHIATRDLAAHTRKADILVVAVGKAGLVDADMIKPGALVVDVGVNRVPVLNPDGTPVLTKKGNPKKRTVGDVDFDGAAEVAGWITPVPGGVGPLTVTMLLRNVVEAAKRQDG